MGLFDKFKLKQSIPYKRTVDNLNFKEVDERNRKIEKIVNNYGKSLTLNDGLIVFRNSTLFDSKEVIETAIKDYVKAIILNQNWNSELRHQLMVAYASLAFFDDDKIANYLNSESTRMGAGKLESEQSKELMSKLQTYQREHLRRVFEYENYVKQLEKENDEAVESINC